MVVAVSNAASAGVLEVGPGQTYATIQEALDAANPADTVNVHAGTYVETMTIRDDGVTLQNNAGNAPVLVSRIVVGRAANVVIKGFEITGWTTTHGILQTNGTGLVVSNCKIHDGVKSGSSAGIRTRYSTTLTITDNEIFNCQEGVIMTSGHSRDGTHATGMLIARNKIRDNPDDGNDIQGEYYTRVWLEHRHI